MSPAADRVGYLLPTEDEPRVRRARNAVSCGVGVFLLLVALAASTGPGSLQGAVDDAIRRLPGWWELVFWIAYGSAGLFAVAVVVALVARARRNPAAVRDVVLAVVVSAAVSLVLMLWRLGAGPALLPELGAAEPLRQFPVFRVALVTTVVLAAAPHLAAAVRRFGIAMIVLVAVSALGLGFGYPTDAMAAIGVAMAASGLVLLLLGSPGGFPPTAVVAGALRELGVDVRGLEPAADQSWGIRRFVGVDDGGPLEVKAYGKDAVDTRLAAMLWSAAWYRGIGGTVGVSRMQAVEHEALVTLFAARAGVPTTEPLAAGRAGDDVAILAVRRSGTSLARHTVDTVSDELLVAVWRDVARLHDAGIAHGALTTSAVTIAGGRHAFGDFTEGSVTAGTGRWLDVANLLFSLAAMVGVDRAVATAASGLGRNRLAAALPWLQLPGLRRETRVAVEDAKELMAALRAAVADVTGQEEPDPVQIRRVTLRQLGMLALVLVAASALLSQLADLDLAAVWAIVQDAAWIPLLVALPLSQLVFVAEAGAMEAAVGHPLPRRPLVVLQIAARFVSLAVPSAAGRVAMNSAFLVKYGIPTSIAIVQGAVDSASGFVVEVLILGAGLLFSDITLSLSSNPDWGLILAVVLLLALVAAGLVLWVERVRNLVMPVLRDAGASIGSVLADPSRALRLLGNNLLSRAVLGATLWLILRAVGVNGTSLAVAITVTVATNLLAGLTPVPGGIGVAEAVMASWLVLVGVPEEEAFAATVVFRLFTFYLPAVEGVAATRWLERRDHL